MHRHANHILLLLHTKLPQWNLLLNLYCLVVQHHPENPQLEQQIPHKQKHKSKGKEKTIEPENIKGRKESKMTIIDND